MENKVVKAVDEKNVDTVQKEIHKAMKEAFAKEKRVRVKVPVDALNPKDLNVTVQVNGYTFLIKRGETVDVPESIANILSEAKYI